ncbi:MAG: hypothetical protein IJI73_11495 [Kiritimatiellae bacterium]|nr:hypothetical protein [Kiritimatiellia bacterium]
MISVPEVVIERVCAVRGSGEGLADLARRAVEGLGAPSGVRGVVAATFSSPDRFPSLAVRAAGWLGLPADTPAFDVQMACSAYPYALYLAGRLAADTGGKVVVVDGDVQLPLVDANDHATGSIFSDACTASLVGAGDGVSRFAFLSRASADLACPASGPISMDGMKVFTFVATEVSRFLREFGRESDVFVPHQANPYMVRQLARTLGLEDRLLVIPEEAKNPGSCSVPMALAANPRPGARALVAGFGAGYSAAAGIVSLSPGFEGKVL